MTISNVNRCNQTLFHQESSNLLSTTSKGSTLERLEKKLYAALECNSWGDAIEVFSQGLSVNMRLTDGQTVLHKAARDGNSVVLKELLKLGADPNKQDDGGRTPLFTAALGNHVEAFQTLLDHKASWEYTDNLGNTVLHVVANLGYKPLAALLICAGASPLLIDSRGKSSFCLAIQAYVENRMIIDLHSGDLIDWEKDYRQQWESLIATLLEWKGWNEQEEKCWRFAKYLYQKSQDTHDLKLCVRLLLRPSSYTVLNDSIHQSYTNLLSKCASHPQEALHEYEDKSALDRDKFFPLRLRHLACILGLDWLYAKLKGSTLNTISTSRSQQSEDMVLTARFGHLNMFKSLAKSYSYSTPYLGYDCREKGALYWAARNGDLMLLECLLELDYYAPLADSTRFGSHHSSTNEVKDEIAKALQVSFSLASAQTFTDCFQPSEKLVAYDQHTLKEADGDDSVLTEHLPNHDSVARLLYEKHSPMLQSIGQPKPILQRIVRKKYQRVVQRRMVSGLSLNTLDGNGLALVHYGAINGWGKLIEQLQKGGANLAKRTG